MSSINVEPYHMRIKLVFLPSIKCDIGSNENVYAIMIDGYILSTDGSLFTIDGSLFMCLNGYVLEKRTDA